MTGKRPAQRTRPSARRAPSPPDRWAQVFQALPLPVATLAADGTVLEYNRAAAELRSRRADVRAEGATFRDFVPREYQEAISGAITGAGEGRVTRLETLYHLGDGTLRSGEATFVPWPDPSGQAVALGILRDTTIEQETRGELVQMGKLAAAGELLAGVTHELNNPLAAVLSLAELLAERGDLDGEVRDDLQEIRREAQRAAHIVRQLLAFVRRHDPLHLPVEINPLVRDTIGLRRGALRLAGIDVNLELGNVPPVTGDEHQLQQMLLNLFTNAEHALACTTDQARMLRVSTRRASQGIELVVRDNGPGVPVDLLPRIFDPFVTTKRGGEGTGLGLSIVARVVREHGGKVSVANHPEGGAAFTVFLPEVGPQPDAR